MAITVMTTEDQHLYVRDEKYFGHVKATVSDPAIPLSFSITVQINDGVDEPSIAIYRALKAVSEICTEIGVQVSAERARIEGKFHPHLMGNL